MSRFQSLVGSKQYLVEYRDSCFPVLVKDGQDLDGEFIAWDIEGEEEIVLRGWMIELTEI